MTTRQVEDLGRENVETLRTPILYSFIEIGSNFTLRLTIKKQKFKKCMYI